MSTLRAAVDLLGGASKVEEELQLQVPTDGSVSSLRHLLGQLDDAGIEVEHLSIHTPNLNDVFFAVTGHPTEGGCLVMTTMTYTVTDSVTMTRRNLRRLLRYPSMTVLLVGMPIVFLVLFVYVLGGQLGHGLDTTLAGGHTGRAGYLNYVVPGILLLAVAAAVQGTAIVVAMDMTGGIIDRFRTMAIARSAVLTGHVVASVIQTLASIVVVILIAVALGFRPTAGPVEWLAAVGMLALFSFALIWLATALGLAAKSVETASNTPMFLTLLVVPGQRVRPRRHHARGLQQFARYQPFTPVTETLRGLLTGAPIGTNAIVAVAWSLGLALACYFWAIHLYRNRQAK